jgi:hypothetical protein
MGRVGNMTNMTNTTNTTSITSLVTTSIASNATNVTNTPANDAVAYFIEYVGSSALNPWVVVGVVVSVLLIAIGVFLTIHFVRLKRWEQSYETTTMLMGSASWAPSAPPLMPLPPRPSMPLMPNSASVRGGSGRNVKI